MMTPKSKWAAGMAGVVLLSGGFYWEMSARGAMNARIAVLEQQIEGLQKADSARIAQITAQLTTVNDRIDATAATTAEQVEKTAAIRQEQARAVSSLKRVLDDQARTVDAYREQADAKLTETTAQLGEVNGEVSRVSGDLGTVRVDLDATRNDLAASRREIGDVRDSLGQQIAHNAQELTALRLRGEREYWEFDIRKSKEMARVANIRMQLNKTDTKAQKYDVTLQVDDRRLLKKGQLLNEPMQLLVGKDQTRFELVVNAIEKDRIRGYVSAPKGSVSNSVALQD